MKIELAAVVERKQGKSEACEALVREYLRRAGRFAQVESAIHPTQAGLLEAVERKPMRPAATLVVCDAGGELVTSEGLAEWIGRQRDAGTQRMIFAVGPADGWTNVANLGAAKAISFGRITLPHELARVVLAEQLYRALTILAGHPYHSGH